MNPYQGGSWQPAPQQFPYPPQPPVKRGMPWWAGVLIGLGAFGALAVTITLVVLSYIGSVGPETHVYSGNEVPRRFVTTVSDLGLLGSGERIKHFYSSGLTDIRDGFSFISDKKLVVYNQESATAATVVQFAEIDRADMVSSTAWYEDSTITLTLKSGDVVIFPVSSERGGDKRFLDAISQEMKKAGP
jgi:hypothetical protein